MSDNSEGKPQKAPPKYKIGELIPTLTQTTYTPGRRTTDPDPDEEMRKIETDSYAQVVRDLKLVGAQKKLEKEQLELDELRKKRKAMGDEEGNGQSTGQATKAAEPMEDTTATDIALLEKMQKDKVPEEDQQALLQKLVVLRQAARSKGGSMGDSLVMAMLLNQPSKSGGSDMNAYADNLLKALQTGVQMTSGGSGETVTEKLLLDAFNKLTAKQDAGGQQDWLTQMQKMKDLGLIYTPKDFQDALSKIQSVSSQPGVQIDPHSTDLELERIRGDVNLQLRKIDSDQALAMAKLEIDKKKTDALTGLGERLAGAIGGAMAEAETAGLEQRGAGQISGSQLPKATASQMVEVKCLSCGSRIPVPEPDKPRPIKCAVCGTEMNYAPD